MPKKTEIPTQPIHKREPRLGEMIINTKTGERAIVASLCDTGFHIRPVPELKFLRVQEFKHWVIF